MRQTISIAPNVEMFLGYCAFEIFSDPVNCRNGFKACLHLDERKILLVAPGRHYVL